MEAVSFWPKANNGQSRARPSKRYSERERLIAEASLLDQHLRLPIVTVYFDLACSLAGVLSVSSEKMSANLGAYQLCASYPTQASRGAQRESNGDMRSNRDDTMQPTRMMVSKRNMSAHLLARQDDAPLAGLTPNFLEES